MKTLVIVLFSSLLGSSFTNAIAATPGPHSIAELAMLSNVLIHHYDCTADLLLSPAEVNREAKFSVGPFVKGEEGLARTLELRGDKLIASANGQMLSLEWTRLGKVLATSKTMITDSPMRTSTLIVIDPTNPEQQAQIYCTAVTFAEATEAAAGAKK